MESVRWDEIGSGTAGKECGMQNIYPLFKSNSILRKEHLWSLRDYSFNHLRLEYRSHGDGILAGCEPSVRGEEIVIGEGLIKHGGFIRLVAEEMTVPYTPTGELAVLKLRMSEDRQSGDSVRYRVEPFLDGDTEKKGNELEVCRFKLRHGSRLRDRYQDFGDMVTEYDTVDVTEADWGAPGGRTLPPAVTGYFAQLVLEEDGSMPEDISFAYLCLCLPGAVPERVLEHYIRGRLSGMGVAWGGAGTAAEGGGETRPGNRRLFDGLARILEGIRGNRVRGQERKGDRHRIWLD